MKHDKVWWRAKFVRDASGGCWSEVCVRERDATCASRRLNRALGWRAVESVQVAANLPEVVNLSGSEGVRLTDVDGVIGYRNGVWEEFKVTGRRGRLPIGPKPSSAKQRSAKARGKHMEQGGTTLTVPISRPAKVALERLTQQMGSSQRAVVEHLLLQEVAKC